MQVARCFRGSLLLGSLALGVACLPSGLAAAGPLRDTIDAELAKAWQREKIEPAPPASDSAFLRRVYLDLCGVIPTADEALAFLNDTSADKRTRLIDRLLDDARYAQHQADVWDMVYFGRNPPGYDADKRAGFQQWLRESFARNMPYHEMARAILQGEGNTAEQGAPMFLVQYANRPEDAANSVSQIFLGVQLQCARCHDHPYEPWKQTDFYGMAAFFVRLVPVKAGKAGEWEKIYLAEMNTGEVKFSGPAATAKPGQEGSPVKAKFLLASEVAEPDLGEAFKNEKRPAEGKPPEPPKFSRKNELARWIANAENPYFARAVVNRVWSQYMGRGLVHPIDDMSESNVPSHPELLAAVTQEFVAKNFDLKWLTREILNSRAYQLAGTGPVAEALPRWFERARSRPLAAEELFESWMIAARYGEVHRLSGKKEDKRFHTLTWDYVRRFFGEPVSGTGNFQGGLEEHLYLNNGELGRILPNSPGSLIDELAKLQGDRPAQVERLFLSVLSRRPSPEETTYFSEALQSQGEPQENLRDAIWALLTCAEFRFNG